MYRLPRPKPEILTHTQKVCRLYKRALEQTASWNKLKGFAEWRYEATLLRARFDESRKVKDPRVLTAMLEEGWEELNKNVHPYPIAHLNDPNGILYNRPLIADDYVLDQWHPWEKAQYIDYFERREQRKKEYPNYYENSLLKKCQANPKTLAYPAPTTN